MAYDPGPGRMVKVRSTPEQVVPGGPPMMGKVVSGPMVVQPAGAPMMGKVRSEPHQVVHGAAPQQVVTYAASPVGVRMVIPEEPARQARQALVGRPNWDMAALEKMERDPRETRGVRKSTVVPRHHSSDFVIQHYHISKELGKGSFGTVSLVTDKESGMQRVCKTVTLAGMDQKMVEEMRKEISLLATLDHPNVVKLFEWAEDARKAEMVLVLEYLPGGDGLGLLRRSIAQNAPLQEALVARLLQQVLVSLQYCHSEGVLHRDIKCENFMLTACEPGELPDCKLIDFGLAVRREQQLREICGTPGYIAPEIITGTGEFTPRADIWSVGVCALELLTGVKPFGDPEEFGGDMNVVFRLIAQFKRLEEIEPRLAGSPAWPIRGAEARDFCRFLLTPDFRARPDAAAALSHPWLERHKAAPGALSSEMLQSLAAYADLPPLTWCCLYIIAARQGAPDLEKFGKAFLAIDADGDGKISRDDLAKAIAGSRGWDPSVSVDDVVKVADLDHTGGLNFTQFVAAGLYAKLASQGSLNDLMRLSFEALDSARVGQIRVAAIRPLFRERDAPFLNTLPQDRPFSLAEWTACLQSMRQPRTSGLQAVDMGNFLEDFQTRYRTGSADMATAKD